MYNYNNIIYDSTDHVIEKKGIRKLENLTTPLIQISLIYKSCLLYYNKCITITTSYMTPQIMSLKKKG